MNELQSLGYISYNLDTGTKKLSYEIADWVQKCLGSEAGSGTVYATEGFGFICIPRAVTDRLVLGKRTFDESDAWLDLWCHTVYKDYGNAFSFLAPVIQYGKYGCVLTLEQLGRRWGWEKTKVWRFFQKNSNTFGLQKLPGSFAYLMHVHLREEEEDDLVCRFLGYLEFNDHSYDNPCATVRKGSPE